jgi:nitric oxide reductase activation protein
MKHTTLHKAFPIVAAAIGERFGIQVAVGGDQAYTDGKMIQLPAYNGNDPNYHTVAWGLLAHEAAHIRYSDFTLDYGPSVLRSRLAGAIEDIRIEEALAREFPGTRLTISCVVDYMIDQGKFRAYSKEDHPANVLYGYVLKRLRVQVLGQVALQPLLTQNEQILKSLFPPQVLQGLNRLLSTVPNGLVSEQDSMDLTDRILAMLNENKPSESMPQPTVKPDETGKVSGETASEEKSEEVQPQEDAATEGDLTKGHIDTASGELTEVEANPNSHTVHRSDTGCDSKSGIEKLEQTYGNLLDALSTAEASDIDQDVFETLKAALALPDQSMSTQLMPVACEPPLNEVAGLKLLNRVTSESRKLRATLQGLVQSERLRHSRSTAHGTRLNTHRLARVGLGETRLFLKPELKTAPNTAIHLLLDRSYSMNAKLLDPQGQTSGTRLAVTLSASLALALALEGVPGVNPGITAFPGQEADSVYRILDYGQRVTSRASAFTLTASGGTPMTEAIWFGAAALLRCREPRKVLLVLTDGQPDELASTLDILQRCRESGIETVGIGLGLEVSHLFPKALRIHALTELRTQLFELSKTLLLAK